MTVSSGLAQLVHLNSNQQTPQQRLDGFSSGGEVITLAQRFAGADDDYVPRLAGQFAPNLGANVPVSQVPEPGSITLVLAALLAAAVARRRRA